MFQLAKKFADIKDDVESVEEPTLDALKENITKLTERYSGYFSKMLEESGKDIGEIYKNLLLQNPRSHTNLSEFISDKELQLGSNMSIAKLDEIKKLRNNIASLSGIDYQYYKQNPSTLKWEWKPKYSDRDFFTDYKDFELIKVTLVDETKTKVEQYSDKLKFIDASPGDITTIEPFNESETTIWGVEYETNEIKNLDLSITDFKTKIRQLKRWIKSIDKTFKTFKEEKNEIFCYDNAYKSELRPKYDSLCAYKISKISEILSNIEFKSEENKTFNDNYTGGLIKLDMDAHKFYGDMGLPVNIINYLVSYFNANSKKCYKFQYNWIMCVIFTDIIKMRNPTSNILPILSFPPSVVTVTQKKKYLYDNHITRFAPITGSVATDSISKYYIKKYLEYMNKAIILYTQMLSGFDINVKTYANNDDKKLLCFRYIGYSTYEAKVKPNKIVTAWERDYKKSVENNVKMLEYKMKYETEQNKIIAEGGRYTQIYVTDRAANIKILYDEVDVKINDNIDTSATYEIPVDIKVGDNDMFLNDYKLYGGSFVPHSIAATKGGAMDDITRLTIKLNTNIQKNTELAAKKEQWKIKYHEYTSLYITYKTLVQQYGALYKMCLEFEHNYLKTAMTDTAMTNRTLSITEMKLSIVKIRAKIDNRTYTKKMLIKIFELIEHVLKFCISENETLKKLELIRDNDDYVDTFTSSKKVTFGFLLYKKFYNEIMAP